jgi:hypothetical protein
VERSWNPSGQQAEKMREVSSRNSAGWEAVTEAAM